MIPWSSMPWLVFGKAIVLLGGKPCHVLLPDGTKHTVAMVDNLGETS